MAITKELKERWIARLESRDAKWTFGRLRAKDGGMCCLGHLVDISGGWDRANKYAAHGNTGILPDGYYGLSLHHALKLAEANDELQRFPLELIRALPVKEEAV